ncbi:carbon-nitrogen hydrolase family protein [Falsiroseomonas sp. CW058]|uniref:carbon-nitrogen hydrolase family protein n=1 Tax=Falsiroseomonas sp. CW058 TaxID=3388664 RepID=UPI003D319978
MSDAPPARPLRLGLLAWPVGRPADVGEYAERLDSLLAEARGRADLLVTAEYAPVELAAGLCGGAVADTAAEIAAMVAHAGPILAAMRAAAMRAGVWLLPGTLPMRAGDGRIVNRAPLIAPDGRMAFQEKRAMTRFDAERWGIVGGAGPQVFDTPWGRLGISVCYDVEFPKHVRAQVEQGAWLVLTPSCTDSRHGFTRVRVSAAARAIENQCFVAVAPTVGLAPWSLGLDENHGAAMVFGPADRGFPEDGVLAAGGMDEPGWVFCDLDPARIAHVREHGAVRNHHDWPRSPVPPPRPAAFA